VAAKRGKLPLKGRGQGHVTHFISKTTVLETI